MADNRLLTADMLETKTYNVVSGKGADASLGGSEVKHSLLLALAASVASASMAVAQDSPVTLRWAMSADSQAEIAVWNHLADMVHAKYPAITVKFESTAFRDYYNKLATQAAANDLACIAGLQAQRAPDYGQLFVDLTPFFKDAGFDISAYEPSIVDGLKLDGKQLAVPYDLGPYVLYYNKTRFAEAGIPEPKPGWSVDEFMTAAKALTKDGKYGFVADGTPDMWLPFVLSIGGDYIAGNRPDLTNDKVVEGFSWVTALASKDHVAPPLPATGASNYPADQFRSGNAAMYIDGPWQLINAKANVQFDIGIAPSPAFGGTSITTMSGTGFGVTKSCDHPAEAFKAVSVIIGSEAQQYIAESGRGFPAYKEAQAYWYKVAGVEGARETIDTALKTVNVYRTTPRWNRVAQLLQQYAVEAFNGTKAPAEILKEVQAQIN